jgi:hypothetical protein
MNRSALSAVALFALAFSAHDAFADPIPDHDYFNGIVGGSELNTAPPGWITPDGGTVDWIQRSNQWDIECFHNSRGCVDLDGSTSDAGLLATKGTFSLVKGTTYELSAEVSGNQRGGPANTLEFGFAKGATPLPLGAGSTEVLIPSTTGLGANGTPTGFNLYTLFFTATSTESVRAFFYDVGGNNNVGPILDHVNIAAVKAVPLPAAAWLMLSGLGALGAFARRRITGDPRRLAA